MWALVLFSFCSYDCTRLNCAWMTHEVISFARSLSRSSYSNCWLVVFTSLILSTKLGSERPDKQWKESYEVNFQDNWYTHMLCFQRVKRVWQPIKLIFIDIRRAHYELQCVECIFMTRILSLTDIFSSRKSSKNRLLKWIISILNFQRAALRSPNCVYFFPSILRIVATVCIYFRYWTVCSVQYFLMIECIECLS